MGKPIGVGINGAGRIGALTYRVLESYVQDGKINVVSMNDIMATPRDIAQYIQRDSVFGKFKGDVSYDDKNLIVNGNKIKVLSEKSPSNLQWGDMGVQIVLESSGVFRKAESEKGGYMDHIKQGAKYVVISAPAKDDVAKTVVLGVNYNPEALENYQAISNASCTTNCFAPVVYVLRESFGVKGGDMITIHGYTADQKLVDGYHSDYRRRRAAAFNIVPTDTGAAKAIGKIFPDLDGKLKAAAYRVPVVDGSVVHFVAELGRKATPDEVNTEMEKASKANLEGILEFSKEPLVSSDIIANPHSSIFDSQLTEQGSDGRIKVASWYDNEWGYSNRSAELILKIAEHISAK